MAGKERIQTIDREGYKPLAGKGEDTNHWQGRIQTTGRKRRGHKPLTGKDTNHRQGRIQTTGGEWRGYKPLARKGEATNHWLGKARIQTMGTLQRQNTEISKQIFPEKEYRGLSPNFHIHASVSDLYIPTIGLPILLEEI